jgi:hypothetical protein
MRVGKNQVYDTCCHRDSLNQPLALVIEFNKFSYPERRNHNWTMILKASKAMAMIGYCISNGHKMKNESFVFILLCFLLSYWNLKCNLDMSFIHWPIRNSFNCSPRCRWPFEKRHMCDWKHYEWKKSLVSLFI